MRPKLEGQVAIVTGASRGIGRAITVALARAGCRVAALARTQRELEEAANDADPDDGRVLPMVTDVTREAELERTVLTVIERLGRVAILVNAAGFAPPRTAVHKTPLGDLHRTLDTCLRAPILATRLVLPDMIAHRQGSIVNIASVAGRRGRAGEAAYAAAKFGLMGFTESLFAEVRDHGIKVCAICPGYVDTTFVPENNRADRAKFLQPADVAETVLDVLTTPVRMCPTEIVLEPQFDPLG